MKIGVYVGSFNPVHKGHIDIINHLINKHYVDKIIVVPTLNYWDKIDLIDIKDRLIMLKFYENDEIIINDTLNSLPYTYQVLNELKKTYQDLYLIIGADNLEKFHLWKNFDELLENKILVIPRNNINEEKYIKKFTRKEQFIVVKDFASNNISSTMIRHIIRHKEKIRDHLNKSVINYIEKNNLYKEKEE